jgi:hypothetical protein
MRGGMSELTSELTLAVHQLVKSFSTADNQQAVIDEIVSIIDKSNEADSFKEHMLIYAIVDMAPYLSKASLDFVFKIIPQLMNPADKCTLLLILLIYTPMMTVEQRQLATDTALEIAFSIQHEVVRIQLIGDTLSHLDATRKNVVIERAIDLANAIEDAAYRARAFAQISNWLADEQRLQFLQQAQQLVDEVDDEDKKKDLLEYLSFYLPK